MKKFYLFALLTNIVLMQSCSSTLYFNSKNTTLPVNVSVHNKQYNTQTMPFGVDLTDIKASLKPEDTHVNVSVAAEGFTSDTIKVDKHKITNPFRDMTYNMMNSQSVNQVKNDDKLTLKRLSADTTKSETIEITCSFVKPKGLRKQDVANDKDLIYRHIVKGSFGLAKWTGIDAPTSRASFRVSYSYMIPLKKYMFLEPGIGIALKGMKYNEDIGSLGSVHISRKDVGTAWFADISCLFRGGSSKFSFGTGPYLGIGLGGKYVIESTASSKASKERPYFGKEGEGRRRVDFGWAYDLRYAIKRFIVGIEMQTGFLSVSGNDSKVKNFGAWIYAGFQF